VDLIFTGLPGADRRVYLRARLPADEPPADGWSWSGYCYWSPSSWPAA